MKAILRSRHKVNEFFVRDLSEIEMYSDPKWRSVLHQNDLGKAWDSYVGEINRRTDAYMAEIGMKREITK